MKHYWSFLSQSWIFLNLFVVIHCFWIETFLCWKCLLVVFAFMFPQTSAREEQTFFFLWVVLSWCFTSQLLFAGGLCCCFSLICFWFLELSQQSGENLNVYLCFFSLFFLLFWFQLHNHCSNWELYGWVRMNFNIHASHAAFQHTFFGSICH